VYGIKVATIKYFTNSRPVPGYSSPWLNQAPGMAYGKTGNPVRKKKEENRESPELKQYSYYYTSAAELGECGCERRQRTFLEPSRHTSHFWWLFCNISRKKPGGYGRNQVFRDENSPFFYPIHSLINQRRDKKGTHLVTKSTGHGISGEADARSNRSEEWRRLQQLCCSLLASRARITRSTHQSVNRRR
jgi:hypothetical protein